jgi:hypothetical protein
MSGESFSHPLPGFHALDFGLRVFGSRRPSAPKSALSVVIPPPLTGMILPDCQRDETQKALVSGSIRDERFSLPQRPEKSLWAYRESQPDLPLPTFRADISGRLSQVAPRSVRKRAASKMTVGAKAAALRTISVRGTRFLCEKILREVTPPRGDSSARGKLTLRSETGASAHRGPAH